MTPVQFGISEVMTGVIVVLLALAVREDLLNHRVPNALNLAGVVLGFGLAALNGGAGALVTAAGGAAVGLAALLPLYLLGGMGAGDVKLMGASGVFLGPAGALLAAALALLAGTVLAVIVIVWRLVEPRSAVEVAPSGLASAAWRAAATVSVVRKERFPYAIAIAVGSLSTLWIRGSLGSLLSSLGLG
jgi:prepilin peptidase CpaA